MKKKKNTITKHEKKETTAKESEENCENMAVTNSASTEVSRFLFILIYFNGIWAGLQR